MKKNSAENQGKTKKQTSDVAWVLLMFSAIAAIAMFAIIEFGFLASFIGSHLGPGPVDFVVLSIPVLMIVLAIFCIFGTIKRKSWARAVSVILYLCVFSVSTAMFQGVIPLYDFVGWVLLLIAICGICGVFFARAPRDVALENK